MKRILYSFFATAALGLAAFTTIDELPIGAPMPNATVKMKDVSGKEVSLADAKKTNGLLVMFSCNTCPYVIKNGDRTKEISKYALGKEIGVILINSNEGQWNSDDSYTAMQSYAKKQAYNWYYVVDADHKMADAFGAKRTPECFLFDKDGKLVYHGAIDDNPSNASAVSRNHLKEAVNELLAGKDIGVKTSRSVGCSIKRKG